MERTQRSFDKVMYWKLQDVLRENTGLKSGKAYVDLRERAENAEKRAQAAEALAESEHRKLLAAEDREAAAYGRGIREGMYHGEAMMKEAYREIDKNNAECASLVQTAEDKQQDAEEQLATEKETHKKLQKQHTKLQKKHDDLETKHADLQQEHKDLQGKYNDLEARYNSLWSRHYVQSPQEAQGSQSAQQAQTLQGTQSVQQPQATQVAQSVQADQEPEFEESAYCQQLQENNYQLRQQLEEAKAENEKMRAQLSQDSGNSNIPSSKGMRFGPIQGHREPSSRGQGGQPGHTGHKRRRLTPQERIVVEADPAIRDNPEYEFVEYRVKQRVGIRVCAYVVDYAFEVYRNRETGKLCHEPFPDDLINEVNYDESVKAVVFIMKNYLNSSERKISNFLSAVTDGELNLSKGYINGVNEDFANRTEKEREDIFNRLATGKILHSDMTSLFVNGELTPVAINTNGTDYMFQVREHKGIEAQKGTPLEDFRETLLSDGDPSYTHFGARRQRCVSHIIRPFELIAEFEPYLTWHGRMCTLLSNTVKERNESEDHAFSLQRQAEIEAEYDQIMELAEEEYKKYPPRKKGFTLGRAHYLDLKKNKDSILLFIHDPTVPTTNALAELGARWLKRYLANAGTFRGKTGTASAVDYCDCQSVFVSLKNRTGYGPELMKGIKQRFTQERTISRKRHFTERRKKYEQEQKEKAKKEAEKAAKKQAREKKKAQKAAEEAEQRRQDALARGQALALKGAA